MTFLLLSKLIGFDSIYRPVQNLLESHEAARFRAANSPFLLFLLCSSSPPGIPGIPRKVLWEFPYQTSSSWSGGIVCGGQTVQFDFQPAEGDTQPVTGCRPGPAARILKLVLFKMTCPCSEIVAWKCNYFFLPVALKIETKSSKISTGA